MACRDRALANWGAIVATMLAVPIGPIWTFVEIVGDTMGCEGNTGPCEPRLLPLLGGIAVIVLVAFILGRALNPLIARWRTTAH